MRLVLLTILLILSFIEANAQNIGLAPEITFRATKYNDVDRRKDWVTKKGFGINIVKFPFNRLFYQIGLFYLHSTTNDNNREVYDYVNGQFVSIGFRNFKYKFNYLAIPISLNFLLFKKEGLNLLVNGGIEAGCHYRTKQIVESSSKTVKEYYPGKFNNDNLNLSLMGGIGGCYPFSDKISLILKTQITKVLKNSKEMSHVSDTFLGLNAELIHKF